MSGSTIPLLIGGLILLVVGAEALVRGASRLAFALGISPLVIGLTVVAFGTSSPEFAVSVQSALSGQADLAMGNVVGSNIFNVLFILGLSALLTPLLVAQQLIRLDVPIMVGLSALLLLFSLDGVVSATEGWLMIGGLIAYTVFQIVQSRRESNAAVQEEYEHEFGQPAAKKTALAWLLNIGLIVVGLTLLVLGSRWLVSSAVAIAQWLGVSEVIIGLTIVAAGTSLPEVATSVLASIRGERDIAVGNVVGSNIFNILGVLGVASAVAPNGINVAPQMVQIDMPIMIAVAFACLPIFFTGNLIARWEGVLFLVFYVAYTAYLVLLAQGSALLPTYSAIMLWFVLPLTALTLGVGLWRSMRSARVVTS